MQLTRFTDYAIKVLAYLATHPNQWITIRQISDDYGVSKNHLMKVVSFLSTHQYIHSQRGPGGGVKLSRKAPDINLAEIILDTEGQLDLLECMKDDQNDNSAFDHRLGEALNHGVQSMVDTLNAYSLADLIGSSTNSGRTA